VAAFGVSGVWGCPQQVQVGYTSALLAGIVFAITEARKESFF
jgi:hypothetical protein